MKRVFGGFFAALVCLAGAYFASCGGDSGIRKYTGTAGVGDFLEVVVDPAAGTIAYKNLSNGDCDTVSFTEAVDGSYAITDGNNPDYPLADDPDCTEDDPQGNLLAALEIPGFALLLHAAKVGPNSDTEAIVFAIDQQPITGIGLGGTTYNFMQFRAHGGIEVGAVDFDPEAGSITTSRFWPFAVVSGQPSEEIVNDGAAAGGATPELDPTGSYYIIDEEGEGTSYVFGTRSGMFAVDNPNGAILGFEQVASDDFDPSLAGDYSAVVYHKVGADETGGGETGGTLDLYKATITIAANNTNPDGDGDADDLNITIQNDEDTVTVINNLLLDAAADQTGYLVGGSYLNNSLPGIFTKRTTGASTREDLFVTFLDRAMLFLYFKVNDTGTTTGTYDYFYGAALKQP